MGRKHPKLYIENCNCFIEHGSNIGSFKKLASKKFSKEHLNFLEQGKKASRMTQHNNLFISLFFLGGAAREESSSLFSAAGV